MNILVVGLGNIPQKGKYFQRVRSGGETKLLNMLKAWSAAKSERVFYLTGKYYAQILKKESPRVHAITLPKFCDVVVFGEYLTYLRRTVAALFVKIPLNINVIYSASDLMFDILPSLKYKIKSKKSRLVACVFLLAQNPYQTQKFQVSRLYLFKWIFYLQQQLSLVLLKIFADAVLVLNQADKDKLIQSGFDTNKVHVTSGGINPNEFSQVGKQSKKYDGVFLGRFHSQKGIDLLIESLVKAIKQKPDLKIVIIGGGEAHMVGCLDNRITDNNLHDNIKVLINQKRTDIIKLLKSSRVFLFPSTHESWGFVAAEAMYCGLPVLAYDLPVLQSIFIKGMIFAKSFDTSEFAEVFVKLLMDSDFYKQHQSNTKKFINAFTWEKVALREIKLFQELVSIT